MSFRHEAQLFILNTKTIHWAILSTRQKREALWYQYNKRKHQCLIYQLIHLKTRLFYTFLLTKRNWTIDFLPNSVSCPFTVNWKSKNCKKTLYLETNWIERFPKWKQVRWFHKKSNQAGLLPGKEFISCGSKRKYRAVWL